jgi:hypothetical protein
MKRITLSMGTKSLFSTRGSPPNEDAAMIGIKELSERKAKVIEGSLRSSVREKPR